VGRAWLSFSLSLCGKSWARVALSIKQGAQRNLKLGIKMSQFNTQSRLLFFPNPAPYRLSGFNCQQCRSLPIWQRATGPLQPASLSLRLGYRLRVGGSVGSTLAGTEEIGTRNKDVPIHYSKSFSLLSESCTLSAIARSATSDRPVAAGYSRPVGRKDHNGLELASLPVSEVDQCET
jgi:hypothetical protein